jgi:hypothetical protein
MESSETSKRLVGALLLALLTTLVILFVVLGNRTFSRGYVLYVDFEQIGTLKEGADVRISGKRVGRVMAIRQAIGQDEAPLVARTRVHLWIEKDQGRFILQNSIFYINARGVIGERTVEVGPFSGEPLPSARPGEVFRGVDAPMMDRLIQQSYANLTTTLAVVHELEPDLRDFWRALSELRQHLDQTAPTATLARLQGGLEENLSEGKLLWATLREGTRELSLIKGVARRIEELTGREDVRRTVDRAGVTLQPFDELLQLVGPEQRHHLGQAWDKIILAARLGETAFSDVRSLLALVEQGRGTLGRFLSDPDIVDEIKETHRILKESPWRALGKPPQNKAPRR